MRIAWSAYSKLRLGILLAARTRRCRRRAVTARLGALRGASTALLLRLLALLGVGCFRSLGLGRLARLSLVADKGVAADLLVIVVFCAKPHPNSA